MSIRNCIIGVLWSTLVVGCASRSQSPPTTAYNLLLSPQSEPPQTVPPDVHLVDIAPGPREKARRSLQRAKSRLDAAKALYLDLEFKASLKELERAQWAAEKTPWTQDSFLLLRDIALLRARNAVGIDDTELVDVSLQQAILIEPDLKLSAAAFSPDFRATFREARKALDTEVAEAVSITSSVTSSEAYINGRVVGLTPLTARMHRTRHYVRVEAFGYEPGTQIVDIDQRGTSPIHLDLTPLPTPKLARTVATMSTINILELNDEERALLTSRYAPKQTVHVAKESDEWVGLLLDAKSGAVVDRFESTANTSGRAVEDIMNGFRDLDDPDGRRLVKKWWFWTAIAGGAVAAGLTTYFVVRKRPEPQLVFDVP